MSENDIGTKELDDILSLLEASQSGETVEQNTAVTLSDIERQDKVLDLKLKKGQLESQEQDRKQRGQFAKKIFWAVVVYLVAALVIVYLIGAGVFHMSDSVSITLLGTTTANVISLLVIVAKYLFHSKE